ncbi:MAG: ATP-binding cassette domain-containing protein, partial [Euryarchaeota archaeon]|nr:ATP-binding cassette domain-containing protein [Euryarchaeota archaeon]
NRTDTPAHVELAERADHRPRELSGGEQQRVVIERELINKPNIIFADNSTANLDSASSRQILEIFRALNRDTLADDHDGDARAPRTLTSGPG